MLAFLIFLVLVAVVFGFLGALIHGLFWLLIIGAVLFVLTLIFGGMRLGRGSRGR